MKNKLFIFLFICIGLLSCTKIFTPNDSISIKEAKDFFEKNATSLNPIDTREFQQNACHDENCNDHEIIAIPNWDDAKTHESNESSILEVPLRFNKFVGASLVKYSHAFKSTTSKQVYVNSFLVIEKTRETKKMYIINTIGRYDKENKKNTLFFPSNISSGFNGFIIKKNLEGDLISSSYHENGQMRELDYSLPKNINSLNNSFTGLFIFERILVNNSYTSGCPDYLYCENCKQVTLFSFGYCEICKNHLVFDVCVRCKANLCVPGRTTCASCEPASPCPVCGSYDCMGAWNGGACDGNCPTACPYCGRNNCPGAKDPTKCEPVINPNK